MSLLRGSLISFIGIPVNPLQYFSENVLIIYTKPNDIRTNQQYQFEE